MKSLITACIMNHGSAKPLLPPFLSLSAALQLHVVTYTVGALYRGNARRVLPGKQCGVNCSELLRQ